MNAEQARTVLLVKAVESLPTDTPWLSEAERQAAGSAALAAEPRRPSGPAGQAWAERWVLRRAERLVKLLQERQPRLAWLLRVSWVAPALAWGMPLLAFVGGLLAEWWVSPRQIDLLAPAPTLFLAWNLLVFLWVLAQLLWGLGRAPHAVPLWARLWHSLTWPHPVSRGRWAVSVRLQRDWLALTGRGTAAAVVAVLHLAAALFALGLVAALLFKGVFTEFRVTWQSQWLDATQMHRLVSTLGQWVGAAPVSLSDIERLEQGVGATKADGSVWAGWWTRVLLVGVVLPRLLLAGWAAWRARRFARGLRLDWSDPYFVQLLADFGGPRCHVLVQPYSLQVTPAMAQALEGEVSRAFGVSASWALLPVVAYGQAPSPWPTAPAPDMSRKRIVLMGMAATPEAETHVAHLQAVSTQGVDDVEVWLDDTALLAHLQGQARDLRLAEREALWRDALRACRLPVRRVHLAAP